MEEVDIKRLDHAAELLDKCDKDCIKEGSWRNRWCGGEGDMRHSFLWHRWLERYGQPSEAVNACLFRLACDREKWEREWKK